MTRYSRYRLPEHPEVHKLLEMDADEVVDIIGVSTAELLNAFPSKVSEYLEDFDGEPEVDEEWE